MSDLMSEIAADIKEYSRLCALFKEKKRKFDVDYDHLEELRARAEKDDD